MAQGKVLVSPQAPPKSHAGRESYEIPSPFLSVVYHGFTGIASSFSCVEDFFLFLSPVDVALGLRNVAGGELRKDLFIDIVGFLRHLRIGGLPAADIWYIPLSALLANINAIRLYMHNTCILPHPISPTQKTEYLYSILHVAPVVNSIIFCKFRKILVVL